MVHQAHVQRDAVAAIRGAGGAVRYDWEWSNGNSFPRGDPWAPKWLVGLIGVDYFGHVTFVRLIPGEADDATIAQVGRLTQLQRLDYAASALECVISTPTLGDAGLAHLKGLTKLRAIDFTGTQVTQSGVQELQKVLPNAQILP